jgi:four helix bundle protein
MSTANLIPRKHFKDLIVWQRAMQLVKEVYRVTGEFPASERYSLSDQMRRAAVSVPSNIAEGQPYQSTRDFLRYLHHARRSLAELETQFLIAQSLGYVPDSRATAVLDQIDEVSRMLSGLIRSLDQE